jgi:hypothetical protein
VDLRRAQLAFDSQDYGAAAEDCQHALEVYLKAYLMRYELISNPGEVNHMKLVSVLMRVQAKGEAIVTKFGKSMKFVVPLAKTKIAMKGLGEVLKELQPRSGDIESEDMKMKLSIWKYSLGQTDPNFEVNIKRIADKAKLIADPIMEDVLEYYRKEIRPLLAKLTDAQKEAAADKYARDSGFHAEIIGDVMRDRAPPIRPEDTYVYMIVLLMYLEKLFKEVVIHRPELWQFYKDCKDVCMLAYPFRFFETLIKTYPHQDIGRYPNYIDGQSTIELYKTYAPQLESLMAKVLEDCTKIENAINGKWNAA